MKECWGNVFVHAYSLLPVLFLLPLFLPSLPPPFPLPRERLGNNGLGAGDGRRRHTDDDGEEHHCSDEDEGRKTGGIKETIKEEEEEGKGLIL